MIGAGRYRRDIDGLRAIAILPVLLFHAHVPGFSGGYVGVDIFFVISGFLITGIIAREVDEQRFSLVHFYERRFRRIMPALSLMILAVLAAACWLYLPGDIEGVPKSALAATLFASNLWFFTDTGYFAGGADVKPLLHTWSLAVEEQFYIGFPILLMLVARFAARWRGLIVGAIAAISLALAIALQRDTSGFTFYLLPTRAWELFAGALLALGAIPAARARWLREALAWSGLLSVAFAVIFYTRETVFPGITALPPVLGAALLLHSAPGTSVGRLLSMPLFVGVGLISYSLYLWHWPLIVFTEYATDAALTGSTAIAVVTAPSSPPSSPGVSSSVPSAMPAASPPGASSSSPAAPWRCCASCRWRCWRWAAGRSALRRRCCNSPPAALTSAPRARPVTTHSPAVPSPAFSVPRSDPTPCSGATAMAWKWPMPCRSGPGRKAAP